LISKALRCVMLPVSVICYNGIEGCFKEGEIASSIFLQNSSNFLVSFWYFLNYTFVSCWCERCVSSRTISWCKVTSSYPDVQPNITEELKLCFKIFFQPIYCTFDISTSFTPPIPCYLRMVLMVCLVSQSGLYNATKTLAFASYFCKMRVKILYW
jgi:hypothetical protein